MASLVDQTISQLQNGRIIIILDDSVEPLIGYLCVAAQFVTPEHISFMANEGRGIIGVCLSSERANELGLPLMSRVAAEETFQFTVSVEARHQVTTGISAADRAHTIRVLALTNDPKHDLVMPGHVFPVQAKKGGVLLQNTLPEALVDLLALAALKPAAAFSHILNGQGEFVSKRELDKLASDNNLPTLTISDLVHFRMASEPTIEKIAESKLPTKDAGEFRAIAFRSTIDGAEHLALVRDRPGSPNPIAVSAATPLTDPILVRVQSEHRIGDLLGTRELRHRQLLHGALRAIDQSGEGIFVYVRHPRKNLVSDQILAVAGGQVTLPKTSQLRELGIGAQILKSLGVRKIRLLTNSTRDITGLSAFQLEIVERVRFEPFADNEKTDSVE